MQQIVDLHNDPDFQALDVALLSIAFDSAEDQAAAGAELGITAPLLVDANGAVSEAYDVLQWAVASGEPGHTFILVDRDGTVAWVRDYGAPDNPDRTMYVPIDELTTQIAEHLNS